VLSVIGSGGRSALLLLLHTLFSAWYCAAITTCSILLYDCAAQEWPTIAHGLVRSQHLGQAVWRVLH
jgi:hypothetical protein